MSGPGPLTPLESQLLASLLREHAHLCRVMLHVDNGEDYPGTLAMIHSIARKLDIPSAELEQT